MKKTFNDTNVTAVMAMKLKVAATRKGMEQDARKKAAKAARKGNRSLLHPFGGE